MTYYFMRERLESEDIEEIQDCIRYICNSVNNIGNKIIRCFC